MSRKNIDSSGFELWLHDLSIDPATRVAGAILIISGSALGAMLGVLLMAADPADIMVVSYTHLRAYETKANIVCRSLFE